MNEVLRGGTMEVADILGILSLLPHRYPFLMVDRIIDIKGDESGTGIKNVTYNEPQFQGHFPTRPVMPGVLLLEGMAQTAGCLCVAGRPLQDKPNLVYLLTMDKVRFRRPVVPGDTLHFPVRKLRRRANMWWYQCEATVGGARVAEAEIGAMIVEG
jgi:3-hydroxyacyl-[acyl-carrier-protein] dehydratase